MRRNIPLNSLRAFEATARHMSFTLAAEELCVSQGAVSRHVNNMEQHLGVSLFQRTTRQLVLTDHGSTLFKGAGHALDVIENTTAQLFEQDTSLNLQVVPTFALHWLIPRFSHFNGQGGDPMIRVTTLAAASVPDLDEEHFEAAILYGDGHWPGMHVDLLLKERLTPVCSPAVKREVVTCLNEQRSFDFQLLHNSVDRNDWNKWLSHFPIDGVDPESGITFETMDNAINAATAGHGIAIGDLSFVNEKLQANQLTTLDDNVLHSSKGYYFVCTSNILSLAKTQRFRKLLFSLLGLTERPAEANCM